jgi:hypothetical protein
MSKTILVASDLGEVSLPALRLIALLARENAARVVGLDVAAETENA